MDGEARDALIDAFSALGLDARRQAARPHAGVDVVLDPDGIPTPIRVTRRSLVDDSVARRLLAEATPEDGVLMVVGDRVTVTAGKLLTSARAGYYDLRGRLALRTDRIVIDTVVEPVTDRHDRADALSGNAGLEVATALLMAPDGPTSVRELARALGRAPSTVSEILSALRRADLIDAGNTVTDTSLFLEVADRWATPRLHLARLPARDDSDLARPLRLGLDDVEHDTGWALTDSSAAALLGAPLALRSEQPIDFYVPDRTTARRAATLLGAAGSAPDAQCSVRVAPVPAVCRQRFRVAVNPTPWPVAHPLFVALDLAQDAGRGREILDAWTPDGRWRRVW